MEAASPEALPEFNQFLAEREKVAIYGIKVQFRQAWTILSDVVLKAGTIPGEEDPWQISKFVQEDRSTHTFPNYGAWLTYWYDFLNRSGSGLPELLSALSLEFTPGLAEYYRSNILSKVNGIITQPDATLIFDPDNFAKPDGGVFFVHDCRRNTGSMCGTAKVSHQ